MCIKTLLISVLADDLPVTHRQVLGLSIHLALANVLSLPLLYKSTKWKVVVGFSGAPVASRTPPAPCWLESQSPPLAAGVLARSSPSMPNPPAGNVTGATPLGGGAA